MVAQRPSATTGTTAVVPSPAVPQLCTFQVGDLLLGVDVVEVREVLRARAVTPVPLAGPGIAGLLNLRGEIVTAVDLHALLGTAPARDGRAAVQVVVAGASGPLALGVDSVGEVVDGDPSALQPLPATVAPAVRSLLRGTFLVQGASLLVLDPQRVLAGPSDLPAAPLEPSGAVR